MRIIMLRGEYAEASSSLLLRKCGRIEKLLIGQSLFMKKDFLHSFILFLDKMVHYGTEAMSMAAGRLA